MGLEALDSTKPADVSLAELVQVLEGQGAIDIYETNLRSAWNAVKRNGLVICSDVFSKIDREDIIEIWNLEGKQLFLSFHALRYFSYTLEELRTLPFWELFDRDVRYEALFAEEYVRLLKSDMKTTYKVNIPTHIVKEKRSKCGYVSEVTPKYMSPLKARDGRVVAVIYTCSARRLEN
jgi:PAS domain-containing protein